MNAGLPEFLLYSRLMRVALSQSNDEWQKFRSVLEGMVFDVDPLVPSKAHELVSLIETSRDKIDSAYVDIGSNLANLMEAVAELVDLSG
jgi:hypothetical protein